MAAIDNETLDWTFNFDDTSPVLTALSTRMPSLLVFGASGIAVGLVSNMVPHNFPSAF